MGAGQNEQRGAIMDLGQMLRQTAERAPEKTMVMFGEQRISYHELNHQANQVANTLRSWGMRPGDRVALYMPNVPAFMAAYYGILKAGCVVVPLNVLYKTGELEYIFNDSGARAMLTFGPLAQTAMAARTHAPQMAYMVVAGAEAVPGTLPWDAAFAAAPADDPGVAVDKLDVAVICYTSGTTGRPKGAMLAHRNLIANCEQCNQIPTIHVQPDDVVWLALPLFHIYAMNVGMNLAVLNEATMALVERFEPAASLKIIQRHRCTILWCAPPMFVAWLALPNLRDYDLSSVRYVASGAAALPVKVLENFEAVVGVPINEGYGLTEAAPVVTSNAAGPVVKPGTVGPAIPGEEVNIVDEAGNDVPRGQLGELICRGPNVMLGYWSKPEATAATIRDGWLHTGDLATEDTDGYFTIVDRLKDMIVVSGFNVYPREVEETLFRHPAVAEAAVVQYPDPYQGESVLAYVVRKPGQTASEQEIIDYCRSQIAVFKCPRKIVFRDALPKNNTGKVLRRELREEATRLGQVAQA
jgi:long-chain acyl-CoA synthetase